MNLSNETMDAEKYFAENNFESSQLLSLIWDEKRKLLLIVFRFAMTQEFVGWLQGKDKPASPISDFRLITFRDVKDFKSKGIKLEKNHEQTYYFLEPDKGVFLVDWLELKIASDLRMKIHLISPAEIEFTFKTFAVEKKLGYAVKGKDENEWDYFAIDSHEEFDFYNPFGLTTF